MKQIILHNGNFCTFTIMNMLKQCWWKILYPINVVQWQLVLCSDFMKSSGWEKQFQDPKKSSWHQHIILQ